MVSQIPHYKNVYTTYRNPYRVAASWGNRGHFSKIDNTVNYNKWLEQWGCFKDALEINPMVLDFTKESEQFGIDFGIEPINAYSDANNIHKELDKGNKEYLFKLIPKEYIDFAIECCGDLYKGEL